MSKMTMGKAKFIWERWRNWLGVISLLLGIRMNIILSPISWWWFVIGFIGSFIVVYLDMRFVVGEENSTATRKNPELMEMKRMIKEIYERAK